MIRNVTEYCCDRCNGSARHNLPKGWAEITHDIFLCERCLKELKDHARSLEAAAEAMGTAVGTLVVGLLGAGGQA